MCSFEKFQHSFCFSVHRNRNKKEKEERTTNRIPDDFHQFKKKNTHTTKRTEQEQEHESQAF